MTFQEDIAAIQVRIAKAGSERDSWRVSGMQEKVARQELDHSQAFTDHCSGVLVPNTTCRVRSGPQE